MVRLLVFSRHERLAGLDAPPWHELTQEVLVSVDNESEKKATELLTTSFSPRSSGQIC